MHFKIGTCLLKLIQEINSIYMMNFKCSLNCSFLAFLILNIIHIHFSSQLAVGQSIHDNVAEISKLNSLSTLRIRESVRKSKLHKWMSMITNNGKLNKISDKEGKDTSITLNYQRKIYNTSLIHILQPEKYISRVTKNRIKNVLSIFTIIDENSCTEDSVKHFLGSLKASGYKSDVLIAMYKSCSTIMESYRKKFPQAVIYIIDDEDTWLDTDKTTAEKHKKLPIELLKYHIFRLWAMDYPSTTNILLCDFHFVFFQTNPFNFYANQWKLHDLVVFQEAHPLKSVARSKSIANTITDCYGPQGLLHLGSNPLISSGAVMGSRDGILIYSHSILQQLNPLIRHGTKSSNGDANANSHTNDASCTTSKVLNEAFVNWLIYGSRLSKIMNIKIYQQGEGPVSPVGAYYHHTDDNKDMIIASYNISTWKVLQHSNSGTFFFNWDGNKSPVVHVG